MPNNKTAKNYVCPRCWRQISKCRCEYPPYQLIMIDENLQTAIRNLNLKFQFTGSCCESHYNGADKLCRIYISFMEKKFKDIPNGWKIDRDYLYFDFKPHNEEEFKSIKNNAIAELNRWAEEMDI